ncbi:MAG TPA: gliding motility-associated C-terminal domain-containing protein [Saprospiraceae bacterium]|nr:gliding motility-associated C-terminal domain-containing protein [Saprospiraceae bacterium]
MISDHVKLFVIGSIFLLSGINAWSQNLVPNPDFESFTVCPPNVNQGGPLECLPWYHPTDASSDYFNVCGGPGADVPNNLFGSQGPHSGVAYAGIGTWFVGFLYREYLTVQLTEPLMPNTAYEISFYVSLADNNCGTDKMGVYFSAIPPPNTGIVPINVDPQVSSNLGLLTDKINWTLISGCFPAVGGEEYITIGNFFSDEDTPLDPTCAQNPVQSYYYVDDVTVMALGPPGIIDIDLGDPVIACGSYEIDPNYSTSFHYHWEDGSIYPTLTVTESGTYALTISDGCAFGIDSVEVTIIPPIAIDIGEPLVELCEGDNYTVSLDPSLGTYTWQDGSHDTEYEITTSGIYEVTLDDGCIPTSDFVNVNVVSSPDPFFLGQDMLLCPGDDIDYDFDPALGDFTWQNGSHFSYFTIDDPGTYALTISSICGLFTDEIIVDYVEALQIDIGPDDYFLCEGDAYEIDLDPALGDFLWQDGSDEAFYTISTPGYYSLTITNQCESVTDNIEVFASIEPVFDLGDDIEVCTAQLPVLLDLSGLSQVTFQWQDGSAGDQYEVTSGGTYSVTVSNSCYDVSDEIVVTIQNPVTNVVLPADQILCQGQTFVITNTGDSGNYLWQDNSTADTLLVNAPGTYTLTVTTACGTGSDNIEISYVSPLPQPDLGPDVALCPGEQIILTPNISGVAYLWQDMSTADTLLINSAGIYYVQVSDQCTSAADTIEIMINDQPPQVDLPQQLNLCQGESLTLYAGISGVSYLWNDNSQVDSLEVFSLGSYSLTVSNTCGTDVDTVIILDAGPKPSVALGIDVSLCSGDVVTLLPVFSDVDNWLWNDGSHLASYNLTGNEIVTVEVSNVCGSAFDTLISALLPDTPPIDLGHDTSLCPGASLILSINTPNVDIEWSDGSTHAGFQIDDPGKYYATISNACGSNADTIDIGILPDAPVLNLGNDQSLCPGEVITLDPEVENATYLWQDGSMATTYSATEADTVILIVTNSCGTDTDTLEITISTDGPDVNLGPDILACEGDVVTVASDISGVDFHWQDSSTGSSFSTTASGTFILEVSNNCGVDRDTIDVDIHGTLPSTELGPDTTLCTGTTMILASTSDIETLVEWQDGTSLPTFLVNFPGTYSIQETNHCGDHTDTITIDYLDAPLAFDLGPDTILCPGEFILLNAPITFSTLKWQDGSNSPSMVADQAQTYSLELSNECGAVNDELVLTYDDRIPEVSLPPVTFICPDDQVELNVTQPFPANYIWSTGSTLPLLVIDQPGNYSVSIQTLCADAQGETEAMLSDSCHAVNSFYIPNVFSPNGDNINDIFTIQLHDEIELHSMDASIYDRWGNLVFHSETIPIEWHGDFNGEELNPGVYVYRIEMSYFDKVVEHNIIVNGDVTLVR